MVLLYHFAPIVEEYYHDYDLKGNRRKMVRYQERRDNSQDLPISICLF